MSDELVLLAVFLSASVMLCGLSIPLMLKVIGSNALYGWRTPSTLNDPQIWYPVNQVTGVWMFVTGDLLAAVAVWTHLAKFDVDTGAWITLAALAVGIVVMIIHGNIVIRKINRNVSTPAQK